MKKNPSTMPLESDNLESHNDVSLDSICRKMRYKILPFIVLMFCLSILDRSNISFVKNYI